MIFEKQIVNIYKQMAFSRCDDQGVAYYFSQQDFPTLKKESYIFKSSLGHNLQGYMYYYDKPINNKIIIFDHGFGAGHEAYMKEIELLCQNGYKVFAYDHTGCMESGGENTNGMAQSLHDLDDCVSCFKESLFKNHDIYVMGHSWGGFSTLNISSFHKEIKKIVVLAGFTTVEMLVGTFFQGILKGFRKTIMKLEEEANPKYVKADAVKTLKNSETSALLIYSSNDKMCRMDPHYNYLYNNLKEQKNVQLVLVDNKSHNPNYTHEAVDYLNLYINKKNKLLKKKNLTSLTKEEFVKSFDWNKMTEQDQHIWDQILNFLK